MARKPETAGPPGAALPDEDQVAAYLAAHPDLLIRRPELLARLIPPSRFGDQPVVDLQLVKIRHLSEELEQMKGCAEHLITTSRSNMSIQSRTHEIVLSLLAAGDVETLLRVVAEDMPPGLDLDVALLGFEGGAIALPPGIVPMADGAVDKAMGSADVLLRAERSADPAIFGDAASLINSFALARIERPGLPPGLLGLGSRHERTFHSSQGTELLAFLAHVLEDCLGRWWSLSSL